MILTIKSALLDVLSPSRVQGGLEIGAALARISHNSGNPRYHTGDNLFPWLRDTVNARRVFFL